jgi:predicted O-methyltransferase YrrM
LEPEFPQSLAEVKQDKDTSARFAHANEPSEFILTDKDWKTTTVDESDDQLTISLG